MVRRTVQVSAPPRLRTAPVPPAQPVDGMDRLDDVLGHPLAIGEGGAKGSHQ
jgi:hypothetical protein